MAAPPLPAAWNGAHQPPPCRVEAFAAKGNGLVATRAIPAGEIVWTETPRVCEPGANQT